MRSILLEAFQVRRVNVIIGDGARSQDALPRSRSTKPGHVNCSSVKGHLTCGLREAHRAQAGSSSAPASRPSQEASPVFSWEARAVGDPGSQASGLPAQCSCPSPPPGSSACPAESSSLSVQWGASWGQSRVSPSPCWGGRRGLHPQQGLTECSEPLLAPRAMLSGPGLIQSIEHPHVPNWSPWTGTCLSRHLLSLTGFPEPCDPKNQRQGLCPGVAKRGDEWSY